MKKGTRFACYGLIIILSSQTIPAWSRAERGPKVTRVSKVEDISQKYIGGIYDSSQRDEKVPKRLPASTGLNSI